MRCRGLHSKFSQFDVSTSDSDSFRGACSQVSERGGKLRKESSRNTTLNLLTTHFPNPLEIWRSHDGFSLRTTKELLLEAPVDDSTEEGGIVEEGVAF